MDNERSAAVREERISSIAHAHVRTGHGRIRGSVLLYHEVVHVTGMRAFRVFQAMLFGVWIEVVSCCLESRTLALRHLMKVDCMLAWRKVFKSQLDPYP